MKYKVLFTNEFIHREEITMNRQNLYLFGDNLKRKGLGGMAGQMRGESNTVGIATKYAPLGGDGAFFKDADYETLSKMILVDINYAQRKYTNGEYELIIIPTGIGIGRAKLPVKAPELYKWLVECLNSLAWNRKVDLRAWIDEVSPGALLP